MFNNTFIGTFNHQIIGKVEFKDEQNGLVGWYELGNVKKKAQDFFSGQILNNGKVVSEAYGNYLGFMDFDGKRYWDIRENMIFPMTGKKLTGCLWSDSRYRIDSQALQSGDVETA